MRASVRARGEVAFRRKLGHRRGAPSPTRYLSPAAERIPCLEVTLRREAAWGFLLEVGKRGTKATLSPGAGGLFSTGLVSAPGRG